MGVTGLYLGVSVLMICWWGNGAFACVWIWGVTLLCTGRLAGCVVCEGVLTSTASTADGWVLAFAVATAMLEGAIVFSTEAPSVICPASPLNEFSVFVDWSICAKGTKSRPWLTGKRCIWGHHPIFCVEPIPRDGMIFPKHTELLVIEHPWLTLVPPC